jgi:pyruvate kinase
MQVSVTNGRPSKRTKIVATLGPASGDEETLRRMILAGLDVARLNFSHGRTEDLVRLVGLLRDLSDDTKVPIAILGDLRGPRIRVGDIAGGSVILETGHNIVLTPEPIVGDVHRVSVSFPDLAQDLAAGKVLLLDDGHIELTVEKIVDEADVVCRVVRGGSLSSRRGLNLPDTRVSLPSITKKDYEDIEFAIQYELDFLALSFVQSAADVRQLKKYLAGQGAHIPVIAKIEKKSALDDIKAIVRQAYGVMVARGDLALEMSLQDVPIAQKRIIAACRQGAIPVITATQMLESMMEFAKPTRAEAADVANAILDGTDALMLSGETAIGKHPVETVVTMSAIAVRTERAWTTGELAGPQPLTPTGEIDSTVAYAGHVVAKSLSAAAIIPNTSSGSTARRVACHRPQIPILALTPRPEIQRRLALTWGVETALVEGIRDMNQVVALSCQQALKYGVASPGATIVITAGTPFGVSGRTNLLKVERLPEKGTMLAEAQALDG